MTPGSAGRALGPPLGMAALVLAVGLHAAWIYQSVLVGKDVFGWDAAAHALWGLTIHRDLVEGNWISLAADTYRQVYWPFLHSWWLSLAMLVAGPTPATCRVVSLVAFSLTALGLAALARHTAPHARPVAVLVAVGLWLTATPVIVEFGTEALTESLAIATTLAAILVLALGLRWQSRPTLAAAGGLAMATYFTKTDYGILLMLATAAGLALAARWGQFPDWRRMSVAYLTPVAVLGLVWFAYPPKIAATVSALVNRPQGAARWSIPGVLYHPEQLARWVDSAWLLVVLTVCVIWIVSSERTPIVLVLGAYVVIALVLHTFSQTKDQKHIVKLVPWLFLFGGLAASRVWHGLHAVTARGVLATALLVTLGLRVPALATAGRPAPDPGLTAATRTVTARLSARPGGSIVLGAFAELSPPLITWTVASAPPGPIIRPDPGAETVERGIEKLRTRLPMLRLIERGSPRARWRIAYAPLRSPGDTTPAAALLESLIADGTPDRILVLVVDPTSSFITDDYRAFTRPGLEFLPVVESRSDYVRAEVIPFESLGLTLHVFDRAPRS